MGNICNDLLKDVQAFVEIQAVILQHSLNSLDKLSYNFFYIVVRIGSGFLMDTLTSLVIRILLLCLCRENPALL